MQPQIELILNGLILALLVVGCYSDLKEYYVSNWISYSIAILALLMFNPSFLLLKALFSLFVIASWNFKIGLGAADAKVLIPIIFSLMPIELLIFVVVMCVSGFVIGIRLKRKEIPGFVPITIAFLVVILI